MKEGQESVDAYTLHYKDAWLGGAMLALVATLSLSISMTTYYLPPARGEIGVIFPPWIEQRDALGAVVAAGGSIAGTGHFSNIIVAFAHDQDFSRRILANGAWMVTAARGLCAPTEEIIG